MFGPVISVYTVDEAIEDGIFLHAGSFNGYRVVITSNLLHTLEKETAGAVIVRALEIARRRVEEYVSDLVKVPVGQTVAWVDIAVETRVITIMLPEDY